MPPAQPASPRKRPTLQMVADLAGVSTATVSYVFAGRGPGGESGVRPETTERVLAAATELNYRPNRAARAMRTGRAETIQLSLTMLSDPWSLAVADAVNTRSREHNLTTLILADGDWRSALDRVESDVTFLDNAPDTDEGRAELARMVARGQKLVVFSETLDADGYDVIQSDAIPGCEIAMAHLLEHHTDIGALVAEAAVTLAATHTTRYTPYLEALTARGITPRPEWTQTFTTVAGSAFAAALRLLSAPDRPTAIYASTDFAAIAAVNAAHMLGLRVPTDVAVIGIGNTPDAQLTAPAITTVGPSDFYERTAEIIVSRALSPDSPAPAVHVFPWALVPGESTHTDLVRTKE